MQLHEGVKKSGIMGFCDPCPGDQKLLYVEYAYAGNQHKVLAVARYCKKIQKYKPFESG
jgi:hypothetical protein